MFEKVVLHSVFNLALVECLDGAYLIHFVVAKSLPIFTPIARIVVLYLNIKLGSYGVSWTRGKQLEKAANC